MLTTVSLITKGDSLTLTSISTPSWSSCLHCRMQRKNTYFVEHLEHKERMLFATLKAKNEYLLFATCNAQKKYLLFATFKIKKSFERV